MKVLTGGNQFSGAVRLVLNGGTEMGKADKQLYWRTRQESKGVSE